MNQQKFSTNFFFHRKLFLQREKKMIAKKKYFTLHFVFCFEQRKKSGSPEKSEIRIVDDERDREVMQ